MYRRNKIPFEKTLPGGAKKSIFYIRAGEKNCASRARYFFIRRFQMLAEGTKAPDFSLPDQNGTIHTLSEYKGKKLILYFYPKDNTPGCTKQACSYSENRPQFLEKGIEIVGISKDTVASHKNFGEKFGLSFTILSDPELSAIKAYDVWKEKKLYGKTSMGVVRTTYLIDENGIIIKANGNVRAAEDAQNMLAQTQS